MNIIRYLLLSATFAAASQAIRAQTPYLETAPISILWNFTITSVNGTAIALPADPVVGPVVPGRPTDRITSDVGSLITFFKANGNQQFFTDKLLNNVIIKYKNLAKQLQAEADALPEGAQKNALLSQVEDLNSYVEYLGRTKQWKWELTAVRKPQSTLAGALSEPFQVFLTTVDPRAGRPVFGPAVTLLTDLVMVPIASSANVTETLNADPTNTAVELGRVTKAIGNATIDLRLEFESYDPDAKEYWLAFGSAYLTCNIRSTPGPLAAVALAKPSVTGQGTWLHETETLRWCGIAPVAIKMGEAKYQKSEMFPDFDFNR